MAEELGVLVGILTVGAGAVLVLPSCGTLFFLLGCLIHPDVMVCAWSYFVVLCLVDASRRPALL